MSDNCVHLFATVMIRNTLVTNSRQFQASTCVILIFISDICFILFPKMCQLEEDHP